MDADGGNRRRLTGNEAFDGSPSWSPDGRRIAFTRTGGLGTDRARGGIFVMDADGQNELQVSRTPRRSFDVQPEWSRPAWSPDGRWIAFVSDRSDRDEHENEIYVMETNGDQVRRLTENEVWDLEPAWRPGS
jgi:TolB protein